MLHGEIVGLRARHESDTPVLHAELYDDAIAHTRMSGRPWNPISMDSPASPYAVMDPVEDTARFSVVRRADGELVGAALVWGIDQYNRSGHLGISLRPAYRGCGLGVDTLRVLCRFAFRLRGLHRLQVETLADNTAMVRAAERAGFVVEGTLRGSAWVNGAFADEIVLGLLATDWTGATGPAGGATAA